MCVEKDKQTKKPIVLVCVFPDEACSDDDEDDEVRKLKVCIELKGLRLSKPATGGAASPDGGWPQGPWERKFMAGEAEERAAAAAAAAAALQRADINRKWGCEKLLNGTNQAPPVILRFLSLSRTLSLPLVTDICPELCFLVRVVGS